MTQRELGLCGSRARVPALMIQQQGLLLWAVLAKSALPVPWNSQELSG